MRLLSQSTRTTIRTFTLLFALTSLLLTMMTPFVGTASAGPSTSPYNASNGSADPGIAPYLEPCQQGADDRVKQNPNKDYKVDTIHLRTSGIVEDVNSDITPSHTDLCEVYLDIQEVDGHVWLYFAWRKPSANGTQKVYLELHQDPNLCDPIETVKTTCNPLGGRQAGDVILTFDFQGNANQINVGRRDWDGSSLSNTIPDPDAVTSVGSNGTFGEVAIDLTDNTNHGDGDDPFFIFPHNGEACLTLFGGLPYTITGQDATSPDIKDIALSPVQRLSNCGTLVVEKEVVGGDDFGFTFPITVGDGTDPVDGDALGHGDTLKVNDLPAGDAYTVSEDLTGLDGWNIESIVCSDTSSSGNGVTELTGITVEIDETTTCTVTNVPDLPTIEIVKEVTNDDGGTATASEFIATIDDAAQAWDDTTESTDELTISTGAMTVAPTVGDQTYKIGEMIPTELAQAYSQTGISCDDGDTVTNGDTTLDVALDLGDAVICTLTNNDEPGSLEIIKNVTNDNGGDTLAGAFDIYLDEEPGDTGAEPVNLTGSSIEGDVSTAGTLAMEVEAGQHTITEDVPDGYTLNEISCDNQTTGGNGLEVTVGNGETVICTVFNDDLPPGLTVQKSVTPQYGGSSDTSPFLLEIYEYDTEAGEPGALLEDGFSEVITVPDAGTYFITEADIPTGYELDTIGCLDVTDEENPTSIGDFDEEAGGAIVTVGLGQKVLCTVTNVDLPSTLTIVKQVVNDDGGDAGFGDFDVTFEDATQVLSSVTPDNGDIDSQGEVTLDNLIGDATYTIGELDPGDGYVLDSLTCDDADVTSVTADEDGNLSADVTIPFHSEVTCTLVNNDAPATLNLVKEFSNHFGGEATQDDFQPTVDDNDTDFDWGENIVEAGEHTIGEIDADGSSYLDDGQYEIESIDCGNGSDTVDIPNGGSATCTVTNVGVPSTLTIVKQVVNDDGGGLGFNDFGVWFGDESNTQTLQSFEGSDTIGSVEITDLDGNTTYTVGEADPGPGYDLTSISCQGGETEINEGGLSIDVALGLADDVTCTLVNNDVAPLVTLTKTVTNDDGGTLEADAFPVTFDEEAATWGEQFETTVGDHQAAEERQPGYTSEGWGGDCDTDGSLTTEPGGVYECTITNDDEAATLILDKSVMNDDGGDSGKEDFTPTVGYEPFEGADEPTASNVPSDPTWTDGEDGRPEQYTVPAGEYTIGELIAAGYFQEGVECDVNGETVSGGETATFLLGNGATADCVVTNNDIGPGLTVVKQVTNDDGGPLGPDDFPLEVTDSEGETVIVESGASNEVDADIYTIGEQQQEGYELTSISCALIDGEEEIPVGDVGSAGTTITVDLGLDETVVCTLVNDDIAPLVTLTKTVTNNDGGTLEADAFPVTFDDEGATWGEQFETTVGDHQAAEEQQPGYTSEGWGGDCDTDGSLTTEPGGVYECTITNDDVPAGLTIVKEVVNDDEGTLGAEDFPLELTPEGGETEVVDSGAVTTVPAGTYTVGEQQQEDYELVSIVCDNGVEAGDGEDTVTVTVANGESVICTITNDDVPPVVIVGEILGTVEPVCEADAAYLNYEAFTQNVEGETVTIHWFDADGVEQHTDVVEGLSGQVLWPGAEVDDDGFATDWPGFVFDGEVWEEGDDGFGWANGEVTVTLEVDLTTEPLAASYPSDADAAAGEDCLPPEIEVAGEQFEKPAPELPRTGLNTAGMALWAALLAGLGALILLATDTPTATVRQRR